MHRRADLFQRKMVLILNGSGYAWQPRRKYEKTDNFEQAQAVAQATL
jgi:hypothetical protein